MAAETAVFGGGCFWCTEAVFLDLKGVASVLPGYAGGNIPDPSYEQVCSGMTGHAEAVEIKFDPEEVSFDQLLAVFFATHDPTTLNRQGADVGTQYRSTVLYTTDEQKSQAEGMIAEFNDSRTGGSPIVTTVEPLERFYEAEKYHHQFYARNSSGMYCQYVIDPKLAKLRGKFPERLRR